LCAPSFTATDDRDYVRQQILEPLIEKDSRSVVVLMYSYGGIPGSAAAAGFSKATRQSQNKSGGVVGLICLTAHLVPEGDTAIQGIGGLLPPWIRDRWPSTDLTTVLMPKTVFYNDIDCSLASSLPKLMPHSREAFWSPCPVPAWVETAFIGRRVFIRCLQDAALILSV